ncbi:MAG: hypothetical protein ACR2JJ_07715 [Sphingomicrobium sp.]
MRVIATLLAMLALSGCATARMHSQAEIDSVSRQCGLAAGELFQDESEKRLLFLFRVQPTLQEGACVTLWAKRNHLRPVFIEAIDEPVG